METLRLIPLDDTVVFPHMDLTLAVDAGTDERVLLIPRHETEFAKVGTVAEVADRIRLPGGARAVALRGLHRGVLGAAQSGPDGEPLPTDLADRGEGRHPAPLGASDDAPGGGGGGDARTAIP